MTMVRRSMGVSHRSRRAAVKLVPVLFLPESAGVPGVVGVPRFVLLLFLRRGSVWPLV